MNVKKYREIRVLVFLFVAAIVSISTIRESYVLALLGVLTGILFLSIARAKTKVVIDEREKSVREKAAQMTYAVFAPTLGIGSLLMLISYRGEFYYIESLGMIFAYITLFLIALYALSYHFFNRKYGGGKHEE